MIGIQTKRKESASLPLLATGLGWLSIGLGVAKIAAPRVLSSVIGVQDTSSTRTLLRACGARELAVGIGILTGPRRPLPLWGRVVGDAIDLATLGIAMRDERNGRGRLFGSLMSVLGVTALDVVAAIKASRTQESARAAVTRAITVNRPPSEVYAQWRDFEQFPRFMEHVESVRDLGNGLSHWVAKLPTGQRAEWQAELVGDRPAERLAWRTVAGAQVPHRGSVTFKPTLDGIGTEICVEMQYDVPGGLALGALFAQLASGAQIEGDLRRFKQVLETGEVVHSDASIHRGPHPARPSERPLAEKGLRL
ncbi:MAG: SRPBCC family protein [Deltaproteobacteria bacterium]|nr:SRPBCC family protein [Deltaproteobacteria bacterium]MDQ3297723.1 SRPBCC family protein [Myxococcota bacterium]